MNTPAISPSKYRKSPTSTPYGIPSVHNHHTMGAAKTLCCGAACLAITGGITGCSQQTDDRVMVFAGSSMTSSLESLKAAFEKQHPGIRIDLVVAGSNTLATQINQGAPADIFISADRTQISRVNGFTPPVKLVDNELVAITPKSRSASTLQEAITRAKRIVIAQKDVPAGHYTMTGLQSVNLWNQTRSKVVSYEDCVLGVLNKIVSGQADLGFVYRTDALRAADKVNIIEFPSRSTINTKTWIALQSQAAACDSPAAAFMAYLTQAPQARQTFAQHGFVLEETAP